MHSLKNADGEGRAQSFLDKWMGDKAPFNTRTWVFRGRVKLNLPRVPGGGPSSFLDKGGGTL